MGTTIDIGLPALSSDVTQLADDDLAYVLLFVTSPGEDGVIHAARSEHLAKLARVTAAEVCLRWVPADAVDAALAKFDF